jgi:hypothetical protein
MLCPDSDPSRLKSLCVKRVSRRVRKREGIIFVSENYSVSGS